MSQQISLKEAERRAFQATHTDGLWDVMLGAFFLMFAIAPLLSVRLGDFWSSVVFLPFWALVYLVVVLLRRNVIAPRVGTARIGRPRQMRLMKFSIAMLVVNVIALVLGILAALNIGRMSGQMMGVLLGLILLFGFSTAAHVLDFPRLYLYALLMGFAAPVGEWLFARGLVSHHGYPVVFGTISGIMILTGLVIFLRLLRENPVPDLSEEPGDDEAAH